MADEGNAPTPGMRGFGPISVVAALGSLLFAVALWFGGVAQGFVRITVLAIFVAAIFDAVMMWRERRPSLVVGFILIAVVTSPVIAFALSSAIWSILFVLIAIYFALVAFFVRGPGPDPDADVTPDKRFL